MRKGNCGLLVSVCVSYHLILSKFGQVVCIHSIEKESPNIDSVHYFSRFLLLKEILEKDYIQTTKCV